MGVLVFTTVDALPCLCHAVVTSVIACSTDAASRAVSAVITGVPKPQTPKAPHGIRDILAHLDLHVPDCDFLGDVELVKC